MTGASHVFLYLVYFVLPSLLGTTWYVDKGFVGSHSRIQAGNGATDDGTWVTLGTELKPLPGFSTSPTHC